MVSVLAVGSLMMVVTVVVEVLAMAMAVSALDRFVPRLEHLSAQVRTIVLLVPLTLWLMAGISVALWMWAGVFVGLGEFDDISEAIYFSSVTATTLGFGDVLLSTEWRLLSGFLAANGLVLFSLNTAFLFEALRRLGED